MGRAQNPDWHWGLAEQLLAHVGDLLAAANWQRGGDKNTPRPKPIPRPGVGARPGPVLSEEQMEEIRERHRRLAAGEYDGG